MYGHFCFNGVWTYSSTGKNYSGTIPFSLFFRLSSSFVPLQFLTTPIILKSDKVVPWTVTLTIGVLGVMESLPQIDTFPDRERGDIAHPRVLKSD